jgi:hypothetical protein
MANEGIMGARMPMQQKPKQGYVSSLDAYDAASSAIQETNPEVFNQYRSAIRDQLGQLNLKSSEVEAFISLLEYMLQYPDQYKEIIRAGIEEGAIEEGDFPAQFDQSFITTMLAALNEQRIQQVQNVSPEAMGPGPQEPMAMKNGGLADAAKLLQSKGRHGDTILAHISPEEARMLKEAGGLGTINPYTGLREYKLLKKLWKGVKNVVKGVGNAIKEVAKSPIGKLALTIGATMLLGPVAAGFGIGTAGTAAIVSGGVTALSGGSMKDILKNAAFGYLGASFAPSVSGFLPGEAGSVLNQGLTAGAMGTGFGLASGMSLKDAIKTGAITGVTGAGITYGQQQGYLPSGAPAATEATADAAPVTATPTSSDLSIAPVEGTGTIGTASDLALSTSNKYSPYFTGEPAAPVDNFLISPQQATAISNAPDYTPNLSTQSQYLMDTPPGDYALNTASDYLQAQGAPSGTGLGAQAPQPLSLSGYNAPAGGMGLSPNADLSRELLAPPNAMTQPEPSFVDKAIGGVKEGYNVLKGGYEEYFDPNRPSVRAQEDAAIAQADKALAKYQLNNPDASKVGAESIWQKTYESGMPGMFTKYAPLAAAGLGATYLAGGFKEEPAQEAPLFERNYTGQNYIDENPELFSGSLYDYRSKGMESYDPTFKSTYQMGTGPDAPGVVSSAGFTQPEYSPEYGRRRMQQSIQRYYSPFLGTEAPIMAAKGGSIQNFPRKTGPINGPGTGTSDDIPAMLSDGEFVFTAKAVRNAGGGSRRKGAARMYKLMKSLEKGGMVKG